MDSLLHDSESEEEEVDDTYEPLVLSADMFDNKLDLKPSIVKIEKGLKKEEHEETDFANTSIKQENLDWTFTKPQQFSDNNICLTLLQVAVTSYSVKKNVKMGFE